MPELGLYCLLGIIRRSCIKATLHCRSKSQPVKMWSPQRAFLPLLLFALTAAAAEERSGLFGDTKNSLDDSKLPIELLSTEKRVSYLNSLSSLLHCSSFSCRQKTPFNAVETLIHIVSPFSFLTSRRRVLILSRIPQRGSLSMKVCEPSVAQLAWVSDRDLIQTPEKQALKFQPSPSTRSP